MRARRCWGIVFHKVECWSCIMQHLYHVVHTREMQKQTNKQTKPKNLNFPTCCRTLRMVFICVRFFFLLSILIFRGWNTGLKYSCTIKILSDHLSLDKKNSELRLFCNFSMGIRLYKIITFKDKIYAYVLIHLYIQIQPQ